MTAGPAQCSRPPGSSSTITFEEEPEMALFPVISNFQHDFVLLLVPVDTENTMDEVAAAAAQH